MRLATAAFVLLSFCAVPAVGDVMIDFDVDPSNNPIPHGTALDNVYASYGVTFSHAGTEFCGAGTTAYTSSECLTRGPISGPNVVTVCDGLTCSDISEDAHGLVRATFANPVDGVCIDVLGVDEDDYGVLRAYDINGNLVASNSSSSSSVETVCVGLSGQIKYVEFSGLGGSFVWVDNLLVRHDPLPTLPSTVGQIKATYR